MKVSRRKWHYRWYNRWMNVWASFGEGGPIEAAMTLVGRREYKEDFEPASLCTYFWWCVLSGPLTIVCLAAISVLVAAFLALFLPFMWARNRIRARQKDRRLKKGLHPKPEKGPSMAIVFLKSKKQKVCPRIQLVD